MIIFSFRSASRWSLCQVGHQADTRWQQHTPVWLPPSCMKAELQHHIGVCREKVKVSPRSYLRAKTEKKSVKARPEGSEKMVRRCHLSSLGLFLPNTVTSWTTSLTKKNKVTLWNPVKERKEREEEEKKVAGTAPISSTDVWSGNTQE